MIQVIFGTLLIVVLFKVSIRLSGRIAQHLTEDTAKQLTLLPAIWIALSSGTLAVLTETLSLFRWLDDLHLFIVWIGMACLAHYFAKGSGYPPLISLLRSNREDQNSKRLNWFLGLSVFGILAITGLVSLISAPNNADSLGYHNARVMHWAVQKSVEHYFALDHRQLRMPPLASYLRLHAYLLTGRDYLFNFTQWIAFALSVALGAALSWLISRGRRAALWGALIIATIPMAILQSMSSQNDLTAGVFGLAALVILLHLRRSNLASFHFLFWILLGLGALTKGTFYIYGAIIAFAYVLSFASKSKALASKKVVIVCAIVFALGLNLPHWTRNKAYFKGQVPQVETVELSTWIEGFPVLPIKRMADQVLRTAVLQLDLLKKIPGVKTTISTGVTRVENALKLSSYEPKLQLGQGASLEYFLAAPIPDEDYAGSLIQWGLAIFALSSWLLAKRTKRFESDGGILLGVGFLSALAIAIEVKWMPWNNRLLLPAVLLLAAPIAIRLNRFESNKLQLALGVFLVFVSIPYLVMDYSHPIFARSLGADPSFFARSRWENYFQGNHTLKTPFEEAIQALPSTCTLEKPVGIQGEMSPEYLLWAGARHMGRILAIESVNPSLDQTRYCAILAPCDNFGFCRVTR